MPATASSTIDLAIHGDGAVTVVLLHGGPGAPGGWEPVIERLTPEFRVLEPRQRGSGGAPLTVARHVADLARVVEDCPGRPAVVGHSWGAMLALAFAAAHPDAPSSLVLVGCGTFGEEARAELERRRNARLDDRARRRLAELARIPDPDERLAAMGAFFARLDSHDLAAAPSAPSGCDARAHRETWEDMLSRQEAGDFPRSFAAIRAPVLMLHGDRDPHPGAMIRDDLARWLADLTYVELGACGHYPWCERRAREPFFAALLDWLRGKSQEMVD